MPRHWIVAIVAVLAVATGVTVYALTSDDDDGPSAVVTTPSTTTGGASTSSSASVTSAPATTSAPTTTGASTTSSGASTSVAVTTAPSCPAAGNTAPFDNGLGAETVLLSDLEASSPEPCRDVVRFAFGASPDAVPGLRATYASPPFFEDASGAPVTVAGSAFVTVRFEPAASFDFVTGAPTYDGPKQLVPTDTFAVREVRLTGDFEGVMNFVIGLDEQRPFTVSAEPGAAIVTFT